VGGSSQSAAAQEARISQLTQDLAVLQEELESKILENERLVMESCEVRRAKREVELKVEEIETEIAQARESASLARSEMAKIEGEKKDLSSRIESYEIQIDELRREIMLQQEASKRTHSLTELLEARLAHMTSHSADVEADLRQTKSNMAAMEARLAQTQRSLEISESERMRNSHEVIHERAKAESLAVRVAQLEEELSIASMQTSVSATPFVDDSVPACGGDPVPCCYRSEYFRDKFKGCKSDLRRMQEKLR
jgi:chromosome segregation ATPase